MRIPRFMPLKKIGRQPFAQVVVSTLGDAFVPLVPWHEQHDDGGDARLLRRGRATHVVCDGLADVLEISESHSAFSCRACHGRLPFPAGIKTWGDLRVWSKGEFEGGS